MSCEICNKVNIKYILDIIEYIFNYIDIDINKNI